MDYPQINPLDCQFVADRLLSPLRLHRCNIRDRRERDPEQSPPTANGLIEKVERNPGRP